MAKRASAAPVFSVITATYNRRVLLGDLFESLRRQTYQAFEWILVDDGSTDGTDAAVEGFIAEKTMTIRYIRKENGGMVSALNAGLDAVGPSEFTLKVDADSFLKDEALADVLDIWRSLPDAVRPSIGAICGLYEFEDGRIVGDRFPIDRWQSNFLECRLEARVSGDKCEVYRTDVIAKHRYETRNAERRIPTSYIDLKLATDYTTLYVNRVLGVMRIQPDGITARSAAIRAGSPHSSAFYYNELLRLPIRSLRVLARALVNYVRYALHSGRSPVDIVQGCARKLVVLALPAGAIAYFADRRRTGRKPEPPRP